MPTIATAGHVDHGKSTLIYVLTGQDPDRFAEEKARGLTIDLGFAWTEIELESGKKIELAFVDVPGHKKFVGNMLAGAASVGACLFVVSAKEGLRAQSWEHLNILDLFGIKDGVVALTNTEGMSDEDLDTAQNEVSNSLQGSFLEDAEIVRTDAPAKKGIGELKAALAKLLDRLSDRLSDGSLNNSNNLNNPRFWVDRSFVIAGSGTVVTATLGTGSLAVGDELLALPARKLVKVRGIESMGKERSRVEPGTRTALNLTKITVQEIKRGDVLVKPDRWFLTKTFDADFSSPAIFPDILPTSKLQDKSNKSVRKITEKGAYMIYLGSGDFRIRIAILGKSKSIKAGETGKIRIFLESELPLKLGDTFVIRDVGRQITLGGGKILDLNPVLKPSKADPDLSVVRILSEVGGWLKTQELELLAYPLLGTLNTDSKTDSKTGLGLNEDYFRLGEWTILNSVHIQLQEELGKKLEQAKDSGIKTSDLNEVELEILNDLKEVFIQRGRAYKSGFVDIKNQSHPYLKLLEESPFSPPAPDGHIEKEQLRDFVYQKLVFEVEGIFYSVGAVEKAREVLIEMFLKNPEGVSVSEFREALSTTRKYALSLLGYFDSVGVSRRRGDNRIEGLRISEPLV